MSAQCIYPNTHPLILVIKIISKLLVKKNIYSGKVNQPKGYFDLDFSFVELWGSLGTDATMRNLNNYRYRKTFTYENCVRWDLYIYIYIYIHIQIVQCVNMYIYSAMYE